MQAEMADSEAIKTAIMQAAIQEATVADTEPKAGARTAKVGETHRHRHGRPALRQPSFYWKAPDKYVGAFKL